MCSKCGLNPRADANSTNPWCKDCQTKKMREYHATKLQMAQGSGFAQGVEAMRMALANEFGRAGSGVFTGRQACAAISAAPAPRYDPQVMRPMGQTPE